MFFVRICSVCIMFMLSACSLLTIDVGSETKPLTPEQQKLRSSAREYGEIFFAAVEKTADIIQKADTENKYKENAILWKIYSETAAIDAIYKNQPGVAFVDLWAFVIQMDDFLQSDEGEKLFGPWAKNVRETSAKLRIDINSIARKNFKLEQIQQITGFLHRYTKDKPITEITFKRYPVYSMWIARVEEQKKVAEEQAKLDKESGKKQKEEERGPLSPTLGTLPEVITDFSDRMAIITRQLQKNVLWQTELITLNGEVDVTLVGKTLDNVHASSLQFKDMVTNKEDTMKLFGETFVSYINPVISNVDGMVGTYLITLQQERESFESMIYRERLAIDSIVERERVAFNDLLEREREAVFIKIDEMRESAIKQVMAEVIVLVKSILWLLILLFTIVLFLPFGLGVFFGRVLVRRKYMKHKE